MLDQAGLLAGSSGHSRWKVEEGNGAARRRGEGWRISRGGDIIFNPFLERRLG